MNDIRLSVIIPGCNTPEAWWRRCIDSVRSACAANDEIICVDDGSETPVCNEWVGTDVDPRVKLIHKRNGGLSSARNAGMDVMQGRYVSFVDSDDLVLPDTFDKSIQCIETTNADIAVYGVKTIWSNECLEKEDRLPNRYYGKLTAEAVEELADACLLNYAWNKVYAVSLINGTRSASGKKLLFKKDGMPCEDIIFNLECMLAGAKWAVVDYIGYIYYRCGNTLLSSYKPSNERGLRLCSSTWQNYIATLEVGARSRLARMFVLSDEQLISAEWANIWMPKSPYSYIQRWKWLREHKMLGGFFFYIKTFLFQFIRCHFYVRPLRRWHLRRIYPKVRGF